MSDVQKLCFIDVVSCKEQGVLPALSRTARVEEVVILTDSFADQGR